MTKRKDFLKDEGRSSKYFHLMLNMDDDDLNPYQYRLLGHYRRVCGDSGECWQSTQTTAEICRMSTGKVSSTRKELVTLGHISIEYRKDSACIIRVLDRMAENIARYSDRSYSERPVHDMNTPVHTVNDPVHVVKQRRTIEEEPKEEEVPPTPLPVPQTATGAWERQIGLRTPQIDLELKKLVDAFGDDVVRDEILKHVPPFRVEKIGIALKDKVACQRMMSDLDTPVGRAVVNNVFGWDASLLAKASKENLNRAHAFYEKALQLADGDELKAARAVEQVAADAQGITLSQVATFERYFLTALGKLNNLTDKPTAPVGHVYNPEFIVTGPATESESPANGVSEKEQAMRDAAYAVVDAILEAKKAS